MLVDQIYRKRDTITFCSGLGIRLSGKKLGRPKKDADTKEERKTVYQNNTDRIEVERKFSLAKRKFGLGLLLTKREDTTKASIFVYADARTASARSFDRTLPEKNRN